MARSIDFGIDLGTTNSAIARQIGTRTEVIADADGLLAPSVVHVAADGATTVGYAALRRRRDDPGNVTAEFKRLMGTGEMVTFENGRQLSPEALSAEVLKSLIRRAEDRFGGPINAAVITIPAMFQLPQCEATRRAAALAGIAIAPLLQEPIAAAIASIGSAELRDGYWLVYDFGGGTFDVSLVRSRAGRLQVLDHDGDNHLGGKDLDRALARHIVEKLREDGRLGAFGRADPIYAQTFARIRLEAERVRIALSDVEQESLTVAPPGRDGFALPVRRAELESLLEPTFARTVKLCRAVLARNRMEPAQLSRLVLVGGPTQTPSLKSYLSSELGIEARHYVDPTQAVVIGAAIYAATQRVPSTHPSGADSETLTADIAFEAMTNNVRPMIAGKLIGRRAPGQWRVGALSDPATVPARYVDVRDDGGFALSIMLAENRLNAFTLIAEHDGVRVPLDQAQIVIVHGTTVAKPVLSQSVGVMLADNTVRWYLRKGNVLPARQTASHSTTTPLVRGQSGVAIHVPLIQGESERADRNTVIGEIRIGTTELPRDLPRGSEVIVTISVDEHSITSASAYIPALDQTFSEVVRFGLNAQSPEDLSGGLDDQRKRLAELERMAESLEGQGGDVDANVRMIGELIEDGGVDERLKAGDMLRRMTSMIDAIVSQDLELTLVNKFKASEAQCRALFGPNDAKKERELTALSKEFYDGIARSDFDLAEARFKAVEAIEWDLIRRQPKYWSNLFAWLTKTIEAGPDAAKGRVAIDAGKSAVNRNDLSALIDACLELIRLLPNKPEMPVAVMSHVA
jgi:molecular chaperone DnaK